jgi:exodeoxyribonuclease VII large subunit
VILIGRGGGSIEDLWAFNDEAVARAVAASNTPVISGVGHETDFTLTDFAADLRAPTPTAAAERATPDKLELQATISDFAGQHASRLREIISDLRWQSGQLHNSLQLLSPAHRINTYRQQLDEFTHRNTRTVHTLLEKLHLHLVNLQQSLVALNPQAVLNRGYAIVTRKTDGTVIKDVHQVGADDRIHIQVSRGEMEALITQTNSGEGS